MSDKKWRTWEVLGLLFVLAAGNLLHFVYDWTGQSPVVGALAAVNESVWEHMKLLTTPWVLWSIAELVAVGRSGLPVTAAAAAALWLLHRTFPCPLTALLTPVNGSPWEMGKLLYWPYLPAALVIWRMTPERQGRGGHCLLLAAMPLCMTGLCWLLPGRGLRLWSLILAGGLTLHGQVLVRRLRGGELLWYVLAILLGIAYLLLTVRAPSAGPFADPSAPVMAAIPF